MAAWRGEYPFASRWLALPEGRLHYLDEAAGDPRRGAVLFVHGNPTWSFHWRHLVGAARGVARCVAVDHLGCGLSDKPARSFRLADRIAHLGRLIDELDLHDVTLVAQDWGGAIGLGAMLDRQDRLARVLLFNTGAWPPQHVPRRIVVCRTPGVGRLALQGGNLFSRAAVRMTTTRRLDRATRAAYLAPYDSWANRRAVHQFVADIPTTEDHPTWPTLAEIASRLPELNRFPIDLVWGMRDWCFDASCLDRFIRIWGDAEQLSVTRLPDAGHWVVEDAPDACRNALLTAIEAGAPASMASGAVADG